MKNQYYAEWREKNRERYNEYQKQWRREYYRKNRDHVREIDKASRIRRERAKQNEQDTSNSSVPEREQEHNILGSNSEVQSNEVVGHNLQAQETGSKHPDSRGDKHQPRRRNHKVCKIHLQGGEPMTAAQFFKTVQAYTDYKKYRYIPNDIKMYFVDDNGKKVEAFQVRVVVEDVGDFKKTVKEIIIE